MYRKVLVLAMVGLMVAVTGVRADWKVTERGLVLGEEDKEEAVEVKVEKKEDKEKLELKVETKDEDGEEEELEDQDELEIEDEDGDDDIKLATGAGRMIEIRHKGTNAQTELPISVNVATRALTVTTPAGVRTVAILPDTAVANMVRRGVVEGVASGSGQVELKIENNEVVYEIQGESTEKLLGILPIKIKKTVVVSAQTGEEVSVAQGLLQRILDLLSF